jgi:hypothetical protein
VTRAYRARVCVQFQRQVRDDALLVVLPKYGLDCVLHLRDTRGAPVDVPGGFGDRRELVRAVRCDTPQQRVVVELDARQIALVPFDVLSVRVSVDSAHSLYRVAPPRLELLHIHAPMRATTSLSSNARVRISKASGASRAAVALASPAVTAPSSTASGTRSKSASLSRVSAYALINDVHRLGAPRRVQLPERSARAPSTRSSAYRRWHVDAHAQSEFEALRDALAVRTHAHDGGLLNTEPTIAERYKAAVDEMNDDMAADRTRRFNAVKATR